MTGTKYQMPVIVGTRRQMSDISFTLVSVQYEKQKEKEIGQNVEFVCSTLMERN